MNEDYTNREQMEIDARNIAEEVDKLDSSDLPTANIMVAGITGSGKSTLINLLCRFYDVGAGSVSVNGSDVRKVRQASLLKGVGLVPQKISLLSGNKISIFFEKRVLAIFSNFVLDK